LGIGYLWNNDVSEQAYPQILIPRTVDAGGLTGSDKMFFNNFRGDSGSEASSCISGQQ
jgi:hypothetical protein